ncbi:YHS domain-containing (seleno)protein [Aquimarina sp. 2201CG1-2-11]|uniref:YHS domain-containing (seleno)protein n=1 Tax=Aquimarina discodermiae TaxID=3231043 RepID=UPI0034625909
MKKYLIILFIGLGFTLSAQNENYNTSKSYVAKGYDVTEYFNKKAVKGSNKFIATHDNVKYKFASQENLKKFKSNPNKYIPQYGGYCAYAIAINGEKVDINPNTFEIRDDKLYLFYNSWGINTLKKWEKEDAVKLKKKADSKWKKIKI